VIKDFVVIKDLVVIMHRPPGRDHALAHLVVIMRCGARDRGV
jgi:hypothetical protein